MVPPGQNNTQLACVLKHEKNWQQKKLDTSTSVRRMVQLGVLHEPSNKESIANDGTDFPRAATDTGDNRTAVAAHHNLDAFARVLVNTQTLVRDASRGHPGPELIRCLIHFGVVQFVCCCRRNAGCHIAQLGIRHAPLDRVTAERVKLQLPRSE